MTANVFPPADSVFWQSLGLFCVGKIRERFQRGGDADNRWPAPKLRPGGRPLLDTARLMNSINFLVRKRGSGVQVSLGTNVIYAPVHQFGATIRPTKAKALFLPISPKGRKVGPRPKGERGALEYGVDFVFVDEVTIPARPFFRMTADDRRALQRFIARELSRGA